MKQILRVFSFLVLSTICLSWYQINPFGVDAAEKEYRFGIRTEFSWDPVTQDILGNPDIVIEYEIAAFDPLADIGPGKTPIPIKSGAVTGTPAATKIMAPAFMVGIEDGQKCKVAVRAMDAAGNRSDWSIPISGQWDGTAPKPPAAPGCRLFSN